MIREEFFRGIELKYAGTERPKNQTIRNAINKTLKRKRTACTHPLLLLLSVAKLASDTSGEVIQGLMKFLLSLVFRVSKLILNFLPFCFGFTNDLPSEGLSVFGSLGRSFTIQSSSFEVPICASLGILPQRSNFLGETKVKQIVTEKIANGREEN